MLTPLPSHELTATLAEWTLGARSRLYRRADLHHRNSILELGAGWGSVSDELVAARPKLVTLIDCNQAAVGFLSAKYGDRARCQLADAHDLPFHRGSFDLVVSHFCLLWCRQPELVVREVQRCLRPGGVFVAIEPDFGGLMEYPESGLRERWCERLRASGAEPQIGRRLPSLAEFVGLRSQVLFCDRYQPFDSSVWQFMEPVEENPELDKVNGAHRGAEPATLFLPLWLIHAERALDI